MFSKTNEKMLIMQLVNLKTDGGIELINFTKDMPYILG